MDYIAHQPSLSMDSPGKNIGVHCLFFLQDLPNPGFNPSFLCLLHCKQILYHWTTVEACSIFSLPLFSSESQWYQGFWSFLAYCGCSHHSHSLTHCLSSGFFFTFKIAQNLNSDLKYLSWLKDGCVVFLFFISTQTSGKNDPQIQTPFTQTSPPLISNVNLCTELNPNFPLSSFSVFVSVFTS